MALCAQLSICCLLLSVASTQRVCRTVRTGSAAACEATLGSNWTLVCSPSYQQQNTTGLVAWRLPTGNLVYHNAAMILTNLSYYDAGEYSCYVVSSNGEMGITSNLMLFVQQGRAPRLLNSKKPRQGVVAGCQGTQLVKDGVVQAMVSGYPRPAVMWFRDVQRTSRITNDSIYQLLPSGDLMVTDLKQALGQIEQGHNALFVTVVNEFGMKRYCVYVQWTGRSSIRRYPIISVKPTVVKSLVHSSLKYHCDHSAGFCKASCPAHNFLHFILPGLCLGYVVLVFVVAWMAVLYCKPYYQHCHYHLQLDSESGDQIDTTTEFPEVKTDSDDFIYVVYSPQSEQWVEHTLMKKLSQWRLHYTTYNLSAIPGQPKVVEKLRLSSAANKIIIVLANDSLTEHSFLNEVLQVISSEQAKVIPVLYRVSEEELQSNMIYRSIMVYVSIHYTDANFDIRLKQALVNNLT